MRHATSNSRPLANAASIASVAAELTALLVRATGAVLEGLLAVGPPASTDPLAVAAIVGDMACLRSVCTVTGSVALDVLEAATAGAFAITGAALAAAVEDDTKDNRTASVDTEPVAEPTILTKSEPESQ